jgi:hypothetical protein
MRTVVNNGSVVYTCVLCWLLLLLAQPLLCIAHCYVSEASAGHNTTSGLGQFVCLMDEMPVAQRDHIVVPAFWPGLLPLVVLFITGLLLIVRTPFPVMSPLLSFNWRPTVPPPR